MSCGHTGVVQNPGLAGGHTASPKRRAPDPTQPKITEPTARWIETHAVGTTGMDDLPQCEATESLTRSTTPFVSGAVAAPLMSAILRLGPSRVETQT